MTTDTNYDVILVGGPRDGAVVHSVGSAVVELEIDAFIHRYVLTNRHTEHDGSSYTVFNYDGMIDPKGATPGAETPDGGSHDPMDVDEQ
ncbi:hypothetical protein OHA72_45235 [Dactylosporangium sp. NBC_01737]|uniref:hypothetical protein n=1 Tax=Dactylosporangium sp. NBC_01737 TaxID=2975959 RepID=UPI002E1265E2|nr:hypothetical protein OHA72_45235 [Dactylosporangium sp. NBC_01737]